ncbi:MAG TPA: BsuPI-related putative proteinase inhibitor [Bryobacteraceae bacterium]|nr:BsuPI-related putative proteinase inhibitor [Bryobacteraceae bacterium]
MSRYRTGLSCLVGALVALAAPLRAADYFPLEPGNTWVYRGEGRSVTDPQTVEVLRIAEAEGRQYRVVRFFGKEIYLRYNEEGALVSFDQSSKSERVWIPFSVAPRQSFETAVDGCTKSGMIETKAGEYKGTVTSSGDALVVTYTPSCADAGLERSVFVPDVGLVEQQETTIAGPITWRLLYAHTGVTVLAANEWSFGVSTDAPVYTLPATLNVRMTLRNTSAQPMKLTFPSGQDYDVVLRDEAGNVVYRWSDDRAFTMVFREVELTGERNWTVEIPLEEIAPGRYQLEAFLATQPRTYVATTSVDIRISR